MDKKLIFAVAGAGKTTYIVDNLSLNKRSLIITYTTGNYRNLCTKIIKHFKEIWPENIVVMSYFEFLYRFCYKPLLADKLKLHGILYEENQDRYIQQDDLNYYISPSKYVYSNRLALLLEKANIIENIKQRLERYFDEFIIDEVQDIAGRDFNFLKLLMSAKVNMLFVGDFYQHTFDTSRDGNTNQNLFNDKSIYESQFTSQGFICDTTSLAKSWRCNPDICRFITNNLGIEIYSHNTERNSAIRFISDPQQIKDILLDRNIIKLHFKNSKKYGQNHKNWGKTKGEDIYTDVCVMLNKKTFNKYINNRLKDLPISTRNKLYVAITRAHGNVYLMKE